ncbi:MAG: hypothetical protein HOO19_16070 [Rhodospirillaceae bacterium]|jgi:cytochrome c-type biogenesis protein|nr:hypothetical protein [Rhodospirillaceae bacterium]MBT4672383.1 hypothetical protein [Rhodospirillaceae bacterium]MBT4718671.1 hypothetical protein [Rhodospirillaceae bacterium]MBT4750853.1 hypothetical protein [Rhodospirillaceae bacterium]MBT5179456.1 hypothetical protein [Rhodospirillaceae bacterium]
MGAGLQAIQFPGERRKTSKGIFAGHPRLAIAVALIVTVVIAASWLVFPYFIEGRDLLGEVGSTVKFERLAASDQVARLLTRPAEGPGEADVDVLYATPRYFQVADKGDKVGEYRPDKYLVFVIIETTHTVNLPRALAQAELIVDGVSHAPADIDGPANVDHHRATTVRFARRDETGQRVIGKGAGTMELRLTSAWDADSTPRSAAWDLPIAYPDTSVPDSIWSPILLVALSAGLLSAVLTPCLLQLLVVYVAAIAGATASANLDRAGPGRLFAAALAFVAGFVLLYTASGAVIGYAGREAQFLFAEWTRPASIAAGIIVIVLGLWTGIRARAPIVCKIPMPAVIHRFDQGGVVRSAALAAGFSFGCMACFGGAIIATLLVYVGALGSASIGAMVMFMFSIGVAIPFLAAALFLSKVTPAIEGIARYTPWIGFASMTVIVAFGVVLVTDNFHVLSMVIYPWLGLS